MWCLVSCFVVGLWSCWFGYDVCGIGMWGVIMAVSFKAWFIVMFLLMSSGIWVGVCLGWVIMFDIFPCRNSGKSCVSGMCVMCGESCIWIVGGQRCWRVLLCSSWWLVLCVLVGLVVLLFVCMFCFDWVVLCLSSVCLCYLKWCYLCVWYFLFY